MKSLLIHWLQIGLFPSSMSEDVIESFQKSVANCHSKEDHVLWLDKADAWDHLFQPWRDTHHEISCLQCPVGAFLSENFFKFSEPAQFCQALQKKGKQRLQLAVKLSQEGEPLVWTLLLKSFERFQIYPIKTLSTHTLLERKHLILKPVFHETSRSWRQEDLKDQLDRVVGQKLKQTITAQTPLTGREILVVKDLKKGQTVPVVWKEGSLELRSQGKALSQAQVGEFVDCELTQKSSKKTILSGIVTKDPFLQVVVQ
jgi:flagella basal body P-ring formation protein FlgA